MARYALEKHSGNPKEYSPRGQHNLYLCVLGAINLHFRDSAIYSEKFGFGDNSSGLLET